MRGMVVAPPGHVFVGGDMEQIELRIFAVQSQDELLLDALAKGMDPHSWNFATLVSGGDPARTRRVYERMVTLGKSHPKVKHCRFIAKRFVFLIAYGGEERTLFATMSTDRNADGSRSFPGLKPADVARWFDNWHRAHPWTRRYQRATGAYWREFGHVCTALSRRKRFFLGGYDRNAMANHPIQGTAADIVNRGFIEVCDRIPHRGWSPWSGAFIQVHDYGGWTVPEDRGEEALEIVKACMPFGHDGMDYPVDAHLSRSWAEQ